MPDAKASRKNCAWQKQQNTNFYTRIQAQQRPKNDKLAAPMIKALPIVQSDLFNMAPPIVNNQGKSALNERSFHGTLKIFHKDSDRSIIF